MIINKQDIEGYSYNNTCNIEVSDFTIDSEKFYVTFDDNKDYPYLITVDEDSEIASVYKVNSPGNISFPFEMSFSLSDANQTNFESCEIADGKLITDLKVPSTWSGVSVDYNCSHSQIILKVKNLLFHQIVKYLRYVICLMIKIY